MNMLESLRRLDDRFMPRRSAQDLAGRGMGLVVGGGLFMAVGILLALVTGRWILFGIGAGFTLLGAVYLWPSATDGDRR